jgi:hypothetical protein
MVNGTSERFSGESGTPGCTSGSGLQKGQPRLRPGVSRASASAGWSRTYASMTSPCDDAESSP